MSEAEDALVTRSRAGDRGCFEELVRRTARAVFARIYLETGDVHRAEDLVQETFLVAFRKIGQVVEARSFRPWLFSIAQNVIIDAARHESRKKRSGPSAGPHAMEYLADGRPEPPELLEAEERRQRVLSMLRSLPDEYRMPLMLRYLGGADYDSIARQLGLTDGSLRGLLHRGLGMLRTAIEKAERTHDRPRRTDRVANEA